MFQSGTRPRQVRSTLSRSETSKIPTKTILLAFILISVSLTLASVTIFSKSGSADQSVKVSDLPELLSVPGRNASPRIGAISTKEVHVEGEGSPLPSAKRLLTMKPPYEESQIIKLADTLIQSPNTVVTGYFRVASKYKPGKYDDWMRNMLSLQDAMVIFTQADVIDQVKELRAHAKNRTVIIPLEIDQLPYGTLYSKYFWQDQLDRDPEKRIHRSYELFWIWLSKSWLTTQAIRLNFYGSDLFMWSDIGCFRDKKYNFQTMIQHREAVPPTEMIQMAHHEPNPPPEELFNDKYKRKANFYHSGSQFAAYKETWIKFHEYFLDTIDRFLAKRMIIVEDQAVLQSVCLSHPEICAYVPFKQVRDNHYFGLRYVVQNGGDYELWRHTKTSNAKAA